MSILTFSCPFFSNFAATNRSIEWTTGYQIAARGKTVKMGGAAERAGDSRDFMSICHEIKKPARWLGYRCKSAAHSPL